MTLESITGSRLWLVAGWTMLHFLWIGALIALVAAVGHLLLRRQSANVRYLFALVALATLAALPACIAVWMVETLPRQAVASARPPQTSMFDLKMTNEPSVVEPLSAALATGMNPVQSGVSERAVAVRVAPLLAALAEYLPWLWLVGTPLTFALLATGLVGADRLRRRSLPLTDGHILAMYGRLSESLRIARRVSVAICDRVVSPILVGVVRPVILLPPAALALWTPEQLEMVLLHELAHVRRWDNLVNLVQRGIESLLFFHPAVWLASGWVRREREHCCDAVVIAQTGRPEAYAQTLAALAAEHPALAGASAMAERHVLARIRTILGKETEPMQVSRKLIGGVLVLLVTALAVVGRYAPSATAENAPPTAEPADSPKLEPVDTVVGVDPAARPAEADKLDDMTRRLREALAMEGFTSDQSSWYIELHRKVALALVAGGKLDRSESMQGRCAVCHRLPGESKAVGVHEIEVEKAKRSVDTSGQRKRGVGNQAGAQQGSLTIGSNAQTPPAVRTPTKESLRYDGKSFDQWRKDFQTELKPERRTVAINAFGAFAANGYAAEVAKIIVGVMRGYDVRSIDESAEGHLKKLAIEVYVDLDQKVSVPALVKELKEGSRRGQIFASRVLSKLAEKGDTAIPGLIDAVLNEHSDVSGQALGAFYRLGARGKVAVPRLVDVLRDKDEERNVRLHALIALKALSSYAKEAAPAFMEVTQEDDPQMAITAIAALANIGSPPKDAVPRLIDVVADRKSESRIVAIEALGYIGAEASDAVPALIDLLREKDNNLRYNAIVVLGKIGPAAKDAIPLIREWLSKSPVRFGYPPSIEIRKALKAIEK